MLRVAFAFLCLMYAAALPAAPNTYAEGQVWEYRTRPSDKDSLLKIQKIDVDPTRTESRTIYHISIIGVRLNEPGVRREIAHVPVSREALDDSVTREIPGRPRFPDAREGITEWRRVKGGVFSLPIARIIDVVEKTMQKMPAPQ
jgi:hypothetical protein